MAQTNTTNLAMFHDPSHAEAKGEGHEENTVTLTTESLTTQEPMETQLKLEDIMDVITSYKCRFCQFSCADPQEIANHVREVHIIKPCNQLQEPSSEQPHEVEQTINKTIQADMGTQMTVIQENELNMQTSIQNSDNNQVVQLVSTATGSEGEEMPLVEDTEYDDADIPKELYVCGQCGIGFESMELCRDHMVISHNLPMNEGISDPVFEGSARVSVGTQVLKKKPGRKKKSKIPQETPNSPPNPNFYEVDREQESEESHRDSGELGKRRIRTPKALADYYYLGRKKKTYRSRRAIKPAEGYDLMCDIEGCGVKFKTDEALSIHHRCHNCLQRAGGDTTVPPMGFTCFECKEQFGLWKALRMHLWKEHHIDTDLISCDECNFHCDTVYKLEVHREIHRDDRPYVCETCGKGFKQQSQLRNHQVTHMNKADHASDRWYSSKQCEICKRTFANHKCLTKHMEAVHSKIKPFACTFCSHTTARKAMMELHLRTHTGEKPFKCDMCTYATGDHNSLRRHRMRHTGQKPYKCQYCTYSCIQAISLKSHMKNKHPGCEGIFTCTLCSYKTINQVNFTNHLEDHKNGLVTVSTTEEQGSSNNQETVTLTTTTGAERTDEANAVTTEEQMTGYENVASNDVHAAQLIYSALNAISQNSNTSDQLPTVSNANIASVQTESEDGVTTHTITFHIPSGDGDAETPIDEDSNHVYMTVQPESNNSDQIAVKNVGKSLIINGNQIQPFVTMDSQVISQEPESDVIVIEDSTQNAMIKDRTQVLIQNSIPLVGTNSGELATSVPLTSASNISPVYVTNQPIPNYSSSSNAHFTVQNNSDTVTQPIQTHYVT